MLASATVSDPAASASRLSGVPCEAVTADRSPQGARTVALWEPPLLESLAGENGAPVRRSAGAETARILTDLVVEGARTLAFVRSRRGAELTALSARHALSEVDSSLPARVAAYRAGFLPEERRALEKALASGSLLGVASTNALELGVDIAGLDAVVVAGYPGTLASFWQQAGRAGRAGDGALVVFVAQDNPLDTYLVHNPSAMLDKPVEATVIDPANPYVLAPQLACAAIRAAADRRVPGDVRRRGRAAGGRRPGRRRHAAPPADRLVLDVARAPARVGGHPRVGRRPGGGGGGGLRADAGHGEPGLGVHDGASGGGVPAPGHVVRGGRAGPGAGSGDGAPRGPGVVDDPARAGRHLRAVHSGATRRSAAACR